MCRYNLVFIVHCISYLGAIGAVTVMRSMINNSCTQSPKPSNLTPCIVDITIIQTLPTFTKPRVFVLIP